MNKSMAAFALAAFAVTPALAATPADILAANKAAEGNWQGKHALKMEFAYAGQGMTGTASGVSDLDRPRFTDSYAIGPITGGDGFDGTISWNRDQAGIVTQQSGADSVELAISNAYRASNGWWKPDFGGATVVSAGTKTEGGNTYDVLTFTPKGGTPFDAWFDTKTHLLYRTAEKQGGVLTTATFSDYRKIDGVMLPGKTVQSTGDAKYDTTLTLTSAAFQPTPPDSMFAMPAQAAADFTIAGNAKSVTFPIRVISNHIYTDVKVNGKGPYEFIVDTGGVNLLTPKLAGQLGIAIEGKTEARGAGEATMESGFVKVQNIDLAGASINNQVFVSLALDALRPAGGTDELGMVGYETFRRFVTQIDYGNKTMTLIDPKAFDPKDAGVAVPIKFSGNAVLVDGSFNGIPGVFQIDTGARSSLTLNTAYVDNNKLHDRYPNGIDTVGGWGVGGASRDYFVRGDDLKIGGVDVPRPVTGMSRDKGGAFADPKLAGNIGGGTLKRFVVTFDYGHSVLYLKPTTGTVSDLDTFDRAGMWFNLDDSGFKIVDVTKGTPAGEAGLVAGDIITQVDGKTAVGMSLPDLRERLRNEKPGTIVTFTVKRDGHARDVKVKLRDLI